MSKNNLLKLIKSLESKFNGTNKSSSQEQEEEKEELVKKGGGPIDKIKISSVLIFEKKSNKQHDIMELISNFKIENEEIKDIMISDEFKIKFIDAPVENKSRFPF